MSDKFYITTAIAYVNTSPHIGFAKEVVMADAIARYKKLSDKEVYFLTGTDEHGAKIARSAKAADMPPRDFVEMNAGKVLELTRVFGIANDGFVRTSDVKRHWPAAEEIWRRLVKSGDIYKKSYRGLYCVGHEAFVTEKDLVDGKCADHNAVPEIIEEENYFFRLSKYTPAIKQAIISGEMDIVPEFRKNEILALIDEGLEDVSFSRPSRDIPWGIPVPDDAEQTMYVWCDALTNYISALGFGGDDDKLFKKFWPADVHLIGKDILRFHAAIWPGMLLSASLPLPKMILTHGFITSGGHKMSKTIGNVIDPFAMAEKYGAEAVRYYLLRETSTFDDGDFTEEKFKESYNANLANGLGNFVSRTAKMITKYFGGVIERPDSAVLSSVPLNRKLNFELAEAKKDGDNIEYFGVDYHINQLILPEYYRAMEEYNLQRAADAVWRLVGELDGYIQNYQPFKLINEDKAKTQAVLWNLTYGLLHIARMLYPFMPKTATNIFEVLSVDADSTPEKITTFTIKEREGLFPRKE